MKYWNNEGQHQAEYERLLALLVPDTGDAKTKAGRFLQLASNIYYDVYNNGGGNLDEQGSRHSQMHELTEIIERHNHGFTARTLQGKLNSLISGKIEPDDKTLGSLLDSVVDLAVLAAQQEEQGDLAINPEARIAELEAALRTVRFELAGLIDPNAPDWMPALTNGNTADADCLQKAWEATEILKEGK